MGGARVTSNGGIQVENNGLKFALDPKGPVHSDYTFVSHAHVDHMHNASRSEKVIASSETFRLAAARGFQLGDSLQEVEGVELLDSGHILGSRGIRIADEVYYTGDAAGRERAFLGRCTTGQARVLIMETTFGSPEYVFPQTASLVKEVNTLVGEMYGRGRPVVLMGYPLGKAQLLSSFFSSWEPLFFHEGVARMNKIHVEHGVRLGDGKSFDPEKDIDRLPNGPWVMVSPMSSGRSALMSHLRKKYGAVTVAFSGWAVREGYRRSMSADFAFPLSDHCDYPELVELVKRVSPETVYTTHGFASEFAGDLRQMGFSAKTIGPYQSSLSDYLRGD